MSRKGTHKTYFAYMMGRRTGQAPIAVHAIRNWSEPGWPNLQTQPVATLALMKHVPTHHKKKSACNLADRQAHGCKTALLCRHRALRMTAQWQREMLCPARSAATRSPLHARPAGRRPRQRRTMVHMYGGGLGADGHDEAARGHGDAALAPEVGYTSNLPYRTVTNDSYCARVHVTACDSAPRGARARDTVLGDTLSVDCRPTRGISGGHIPATLRDAPAPCVAGD